MKTELNLKEMERGDLACKAMCCALDGANGIYIPQIWAENYRGHGSGVEDSDWDILLEGPGHEEYWEAWDTVLDDWRSPHGETLLQDGDLWLVNQSLINDWEEATGEEFWN